MYSLGQWTNNITHSYLMEQCMDIVGMPKLTDCLLRTLMTLLYHVKTCDCAVRL